MSRLPNFPSPFGAYYDPNPQHRLDRPLVVCSFFGAGGNAVARRLAALGGWTYIDVYDETAHRLGNHRATSEWNAEHPDWSTTQEAVLARAIQHEPSPVIGLPDGCTLPTFALDLVRDRTDILLVDMDWLVLQERLLDEILLYPEKYPEFAEQPIPDLHTLRVLYAKRADLYRLANLRIDAKDLSVTTMASRALQILGNQTARQTIR